METLFLALVPIIAGVIGIIWVNKVELKISKDRKVESKTLRLVGYLLIGGAVIDLILIFSGRYPFVSLIALLLGIVLMQVNSKKI